MLRAINKLLPDRISYQREGILSKNETMCSDDGKWKPSEMFLIICKAHVLKLAVQEGD
jgi:hypothetical protein